MLLLNSEIKRKEETRLLPPCREEKKSNAVGLLLRHKKKIETENRLNTGC
jgi:hypothetical protein